MTRNTIHADTVERKFYGSFDVSKIGGKEEHAMAVAYVPGAGLVTYAGTGKPVSDIPGSCSGVNCKECSRKCYAIRDYRRFVNYSLHCMANTLQLREDPEEHFRQMMQAIEENEIDLVRMTQSGEIENNDQFDRIVDLVETSHVELYLYTKAYDVLYWFFEECGRELPDGMTVLISIWGTAGVEAWNRLKHHKGVKAFVVNNDGIKADATCPAYQLIDGRVQLVKEDYAKCGNCRLCTSSRKCKVIRCREHR